MKAVGVIIAGILILLLGSALAIGGYWGLGLVVDMFNRLEPQLAIITAIISVVALLCASIVAGGLKWTGRREAECRMRAEKADLYEKILLLWGEILSNRMKVLEPSVLDDLQKLERVLTLRGSAKVLKHYGEFQVCVKTNGLHASELPPLIAKLTLEMQKDLGESTLNVDEHDLLTVLNVVRPQDRSSSSVQTPLSPVSMTQKASVCRLSEGSMP